MILERSDHPNLIKVIGYFLLAPKGLCYALYLLAFCANNTAFPN